MSDGLSQAVQRFEAYCRSAWTFLGLQRPGFAGWASLEVGRTGAIGVCGGGWWSEEIRDSNTEVQIQIVLGDLSHPPAPQALVAWLGRQLSLSTGHNTATPDACSMRFSGRDASMLFDCLSIRLACHAGFSQGS